MTLCAIHRLRKVFYFVVYTEKPVILWILQVGQYTELVFSCILQCIVASGCHRDDCTAGSVYTSLYQSHSKVLPI